MSLFQTPADLSPKGGDRSPRSTCPQGQGAGGDRSPNDPRKSRIHLSPTRRGQVGDRSSGHLSPLSPSLQGGQGWGQGRGRHPSAPPSSSSRCEHGDRLTGCLWLALLDPVADLAVAVRRKRVGGSVEAIAGGTKGMERRHRRGPRPMTKPIKDTPTTVDKVEEFAAQASCLDCTQAWSARNSLAVASIHARSFGHRVVAHSTLHVTYDGRDEVDR